MEAFQKGSMQTKGPMCAFQGVSATLYMQLSFKLGIYFSCISEDFFCMAYSYGEPFSINQLKGKYRSLSWQAVSFP